jgi:hypothetical protein
MYIVNYGRKRTNAAGYHLRNGKEQSEFGLVDTFVVFRQELCRPIGQWASKGEACQRANECTPIHVSSLDF